MTNQNLLERPVIENWMDDYRREFREHALETIQEILRIENISSSKIKFFKGGASNVVSFIETQSGANLVIKLMQPHQYTDESHFYSFLEKQGLKTLQVHSSGVHDNVHYIIMEHIQFPTLNETNIDEALEKELFRNLGKTIAKINQIPIEGFGSLENGKGEYATIDEYLLENYTSYEFVAAIKSKTGIEFPSKAFTILREHMEENGTFLIHGDLNLGNCFVTDRKDIILFDPYPYSSFQFMDLGLLLTYLVRGTGGRYEEIREQFLLGYREITDVSDQLVSTAIIINSYRKILTAIRKDNQPRLEAYIELFNREIRNL